MPNNVGNPLFDALTTTVMRSTVAGDLFTWSREGVVMGEDLRGIFDARHYAAEVDGEVAVSDYSPSLACRRDAVDFGVPDGITAEDVVTVRGTDYVVKDLRPDSEGLVVLVLSRSD